LHRRAGTLVVRVAVVAAGTRIHCAHKHEIRRKGSRLLQKSSISKTLSNVVTGVKSGSRLHISYRIGILEFSDLSKKGYDSIQVPKRAGKMRGGTGSGEGKMEER